MMCTAESRSRASGLGPQEQDESAERERVIGACCLFTAIPVVRVSCLCRSSVLARGRPA